MSSKIISVIKKDRRTVSCMVRFNTGEQIEQHMTLENYEMVVLFEEMKERYGITDEDLGKIEDAVRENADRDRNDEEA